MKISIITVVKNDKNNIEKTIISILEQQNINLEYIVVDGKSNDGTFEIIDKYKDKISKIITENDMGIYDAMNKGINSASGEIIGFCNSGDSIKKNGLHEVVDNFNEKNCDYLFTTTIRNYTGKQIKKHGLNEKRIFYNFDFATCHSTGFYLKKYIHREVGLYDIKFKCSADYDFYLRMIKSKKYQGSSNDKNTIVGEVAQGGFSSTYTFLEHLHEETRIRIKNNQNILLISLIYCNSLIKNMRQVIKSIKKLILK